MSESVNELLNTSLANREILSKYLDEFTLVNLFKIPEGYNNNIIWQIGHMIGVQQQLVYGLSGLSLMVNEDFMKRYGRGSVPEEIIDENAVDEIKSLLMVTLMKTKEDLSKNMFKNYKPFNTAIGMELKNVEDAIKFNNFHDKIHLERIQALVGAIESS
ncbi:DinB family protein [Ascidiimonas sp. W6]|uniref:DinB family protein n=1 Tax=Ascidiimonas meishanensis TaxID=3128903 RepID=UPI0030EF4A25